MYSKYLAYKYRVGDKSDFLYLYCTCTIIYLSAHASQGKRESISHPKPTRARDSQSASPIEQSNLLHPPSLPQMSDAAGDIPSAPISTDPPTESTQPESAVPPPPAEEQPPGIRARAFREVLKRAFNQTLKGCTPENIGQCFPTAAKYRPGLIKDVHKQLVEQYEKLGMVGCFELIE